MPQHSACYCNACEQVCTPFETPSPFPHPYPIPAYLPCLGLLHDAGLNESPAIAGFGWLDASVSDDIEQSGQGSCCR